MKATDTGIWAVFYSFPTDLCLRKSFAGVRVSSTQTWNNVKLQSIRCISTRQPALLKNNNKKTENKTKWRSFFQLLSLSQGQSSFFFFIPVYRYKISSQTLGSVYINRFCFNSAATHLQLFICGRTDMEHMLRMKNIITFCWNFKHHSHTWGEKKKKRNPDVLCSWSPAPDMFKITGHHELRNKKREITLQTPKK